MTLCVNDIIAIYIYIYILVLAFSACGKVLWNRISLTDVMLIHQPIDVGVLTLHQLKKYVF